MHMLGCWQLPPFLPQPQWLQTRVPCPDLGFSSRKGEFFENILPELLLQFVTVPGTRQWMPPHGLEAGDRLSSPRCEGHTLGAQLSKV